MDEQVRIEPVSLADAEAVAALAHEIWRVHYPAIISLAQIEYMLVQRYEPRIVREELGRDDIWWDKLMAGDAMAGFASYFLTGHQGEMKLDKLYVHPLHQRRGYGGRLIAHVERKSWQRGCGRLVLAVNKNNRSAIDAYLKHGFRIEDAVVKDIGGGFVMDDYVMAKRVMGEA